jgi:hypothetical protein
MIVYFGFVKNLVMLQQTPIISRNSWTKGQLEGLAHETVLHLPALCRQASVLLNLRAVELLGRIWQRP